MPSFKCIEAFALAAESLSFTAAASALHITVPAVSRRIQALEADLGVALFRRTHRTVKLTRVGESYAQQLSPAIEALRHASDIARFIPRNSVRIGVPPCLATSWLLPRFHKFYAEHRRIAIEFDTSAASTDFERSDDDLAIQLGRRSWQGLCVDEFLDVSIYPVCNPQLIRAEDSGGSSDQLAGQQLLACKNQNLWPQWVALAGISEPSGLRVSSFDNSQIMYEAAINGFGIALAVDASVQPYLDAGRLVRVPNLQPTLREKFYLVHRPRARERVPVRLLHRWLMAEAEKWRNRTAESTAGLADSRMMCRVGAEP